MNEQDYNPIRLEVFKHLFASIAEEMGVVLRKTSLSPNIKERRDFSCAVFDPQARMIAQAAHIPVHLGSMPLSVRAVIDKFAPGTADAMQDGDTVIVNDPYQGGTHLPDITLVSPVYSAGDLLGYVACRAHHADVGGMLPGSMPIANEIYQEGLIIPPVKLVRSGTIDAGIIGIILANVRTPQERAGDLEAQIAANQRGAERLKELAMRYGREPLQANAEHLLAYTERMTRSLLEEIPDGNYVFQDDLDDDGLSDQPVRIQAEIRISGSRAVVDFRGTSAQVSGSLNAVYAISVSAVYYVFRCLLGADIPNNSGCMAPIEILAPEASVVNARHPAPVAGGNVETSQRLVDVLLGALSQAVPDRIPAASQGTMNNLTIGGYDPARRQNFTYYETIAGGMGARPNSPGPSGVHSHMTNTLNTPIEAIEYAYPLQVVRYEIRAGSGGAGKNPGGDGICRGFRFLADAQVSLITERRRKAPYGLRDGKPGMPGRNLLMSGRVEKVLPGKGTFELKAGDILTICTPGGGGHGSPEL